MFFVKKIFFFYFWVIYLVNLFYSYLHDFMVMYMDFVCKKELFWTRITL